MQLPLIIDVLNGHAMIDMRIAQVDMSIINGEFVVLGGKLLTLDVDALIKEHNIVSQRICSIILDAAKK